MVLKKYTLTNANGMTVEVINYGGIVTSIQVPDKNGKLATVVLGFDDITQYIKSNPSYYGAIIGRYANRIGGAQFTLYGQTYTLFKNDGANALHGGKVGFDKVFWDVEEQEPGKALKLVYLSKDMEEGFPGNLHVEVRYTLNDRNEFAIDYTATTDKTTPINLTNHAYFNLSGDPTATIYDHQLIIDADTYTVTDAACIPTGEIRALEEELDFRLPRAIGEHIANIHDGYNHNYILNHPGADRVVARVRDPKTGRSMEMRTTEPGVQLYTGHYLASPYTGLALEAQHFADSPNKPEFPSTLLRPGEIYRQTTTYRFNS